MAVVSTKGTENTKRNYLEAMRHVEDKKGRLLCKVITAKTCDTFQVTPM